MESGRAMVDRSPVFGLFCHPHNSGVTDKFDMQ